MSDAEPMSFSDNMKDGYSLFYHPTLYIFYGEKKNRFGGSFYLRIESGEWRIDVEKRLCRFSSLIVQCLPFVAVLWGDNDNFAFDSCGTSKPVPYKTPRREHAF